MAKECSWCGGRSKEYTEFYQGETFCHPNHRVYWLKSRFPSHFGELEPEALASKGVEIEVDKEDNKPAVRAMTTSQSLSRTSKRPLKE